ncbi:hypothetical protein E2562_036713 [Oryza meyeriana var. granulata]|uniref:Uncharacterized protein n=1 Tax=Oryza meyeriana var. granulata TaxID=110450 RepID=A0A6G1CM78_9ORYZ|nr:hypothetical protein E2562_036713 [Oryza meyeriana var. granulata]
MSVLGGTRAIGRYTAALVVDLVTDDVLLHGEAERAPATDMAVVGLEILYLDLLRIENINVPREGYRVTVWTNDMINKVIQLDTLPDDNFGP